MSKKQPLPLVVVPTSMAEFEEFIGNAGKIQGTIATENANMKAEVAAIEKKYESRLKPLNGKLKEYVDGAAAYAQAHRNELTQSEKLKTVTLSTGTVSWRLSPWKCTVRKWDTLVELMLKRAKRNKLIASLLRTKVEFNKEAAIASREAVEKLGLPGVEFSQGEVLTITPNAGTELEVSESELKRLVG